jgi:hypothetical protein
MRESGEHATMRELAEVERAENLAFEKILLG